MRVVTVVEAADHAVQVKLSRKRTLADAAKVAAGDIDVLTMDSVKAYVDKAVKITARQAKVPSASTSKVCNWSRPDLITNWDDLASFVQEAQDRWLPEDVWRYAGAEATAEAIAEAHRWSSSETGRPSSSEEARAQRGSWQSWRIEGKGQGPRLSGSDSGGDIFRPPHASILHFRYDVPSSYPDWLLTIPTPIAIDYLTLYTPLNVLLASQYKELVHVSPGVTLPKEIAYNISVGMRFMFHSQRNSALIKMAWADFERRLRWRLFFSFSNGDNTDYDPDYEIARPKKYVQPPALPPYIEHGISLGRIFVQNTISKVPTEKPEDIPYSSLAPPVNMLRSFILQNDYLITGTDKNLGIAVSKKEWIIEKCFDLLADINNYKERSIIEVNARCNYQCNEMIKLALYAYNELDSKQLALYLRSKVTPFEDESKNVREKHSVPTFYGIPKIHKEPVKMRPIIPCHSAIQNPAAKFVSKSLKPLVKAASTIIHGSKDLAIKLSKLVLKPGRKWYICTGDVVAYYPNIPIDHCIDIVLDLYEESVGTKGLSAEELNRLDKKTIHTLELFTRCLLVGNKHLITHFQGRYFEQMRGLAMGVADSPDLANLYGWFFERNSPVLQDARTAFYGRYIDDCFAIVYAATETEALNFVSQLKFDECVIEWNVSGASAPFLDMLVYKDSYGTIQHMPYRKARNHQERVPWISHHPFDVKRGTFIGEMSRLATLSSTHDTYLEALRSLGGLYAKRGYPLDLIKSWLKKYTAERWSKRLNVDVKDSARAEVLVLKSEFNTTWNYFSASQLGDTIIGFWREYLERAERDNYSIKFPKFSSAAADLKDVPNDLTTLLHTRDGFCAVPDLRKIGFLNRRMIVSRKRTLNLFDLTTLWKKIVLAGYEQDVFQHPGTPLDTHSDGDNSTNSDGDDHNGEGFVGLFNQEGPLLERGLIVRRDSPIRRHPNPFEIDSD